MVQIGPTPALNGGSWLVERQVVRPKVIYPPVGVERGVVECEEHHITVPSGDGRRGLYNGSNEEENFSKAHI